MLAQRNEISRALHNGKTRWYLHRNEILFRNRLRTLLSLLVLSGRLNLYTYMCVNERWLHSFSRQNRKFYTVPREMKRYIVAISAPSCQSALFFPATFSGLVLILISSGIVVSLYICHVMVIKKKKKKTAVHFPNATDNGAKRDTQVRR